MRLHSKQSKLIHTSQNSLLRYSQFENLKSLNYPLHLINELCNLYSSGNREYAYSMKKSFTLTSCLFCTTLLLLLNVTGCATRPIISKHLTWQQQQQNNKKRANWHARGKIGFSNGKQGGNASFDWQQRGEQFNIKLMGPFRIDTIHIYGRPGAVQLATSEGVNQTAATPEAIIKQQLGWTVPVAGLVHWAKGIPIPMAPIEAIQLSDENRLITLKQQGWTIKYSDYQPFEQFILPTKMTLQYENIKIKLIFKNWL